MIEPRQPDVRRGPWQPGRWPTPVPPRRPLAAAVAVWVAAIVTVVAMALTSLVANFLLSWEDLEHPKPPDELPFWATPTGYRALALLFVLVPVAVVMAGVGLAKERPLWLGAAAALLGAIWPVLLLGLGSPG